jgi:hypothetical protein
MPARVVLALTIANTMAQVFATGLNGATLVLYEDTTAAPATPEQPVPVNAVELVRFALPNSGAATATDGVVTVAALDPVAWYTSGRVGWARVEYNDATGLMIPNVGTDDEALVLTSLDAVEGAPVSVVAWQFVVPTLQGDG